MPLRSNQSVSFAELKQHQRQSDPCVLRSVRPLTDTSAKLTKRSNIPRSYSDPTRHKVAYRSLHLDESDSSRARLGPPPFYASTQNRRHSVKLSYKESNAKVATIEYTKPFITPTTISSPQPLDLHGLPNGLDDIESPQVNLVPVQRRTKGDSPTKLAEVKKNRRRGVVLTEAVSDQSSEFALVISAPLETEQGNTEIKPRTIAEQRILMRELAKASNVPFELPDSDSEKNRNWAKPKPRSVEVLNDLPPRPRASSGGKMADKIQRTIRALYDGNSSRRASMERLDGEMSDDESMKLKPMHLGSKSESRWGTFIQRGAYFVLAHYIPMLCSFTLPFKIHWWWPLVFFSLKYIIQSQLPKFLKHFFYVDLSAVFAKLVYQNLNIAQYYFSKK